MSKRAVKIRGMSVGQDPKPTMYVDLDEEDLDVLDNLDVGSKVTLLISGKVAGFSKDQTTNTAARGTLRLESYDVEVDGVQNYKDLVD